MKDKGKTQKQPSKELTQLRRRLVELEKKDTERKQAEEALRESEERYRVLFEEARDGIALADADTGILLDCNQALADLIGRNRAELIGQHQAILHPPSSNNTGLSTTFKKHLTNKKGQVLETQVLTVTGEIREVEIKANLLYLQGRKMLQGIFRDITERKRAEEALRKSEEKYRSIIENMQEGYFENDLAGNFTFVNDALCRILGYPKEELIGKNNRQYTDEKTAKKIYQVYNRIYRTGEPSKGIEEEYIRKDGTKLFAELSVALISDAEGKPIGFRGIARDVTERKQAEEALRLSEEKYRDLVENINDIIYTTDERGIVTYIAPGIESISGYAPSEIIGRSFSEFVYPEDIPSMMDKFQEVVSGHAEAHEYRMVTKSGDVRWARTSSSPFFKETRVIGLRGVMADITDLKLAEEALRESEQRYRGLFETTAEGILVADLKSKRFLYANPAICSMLCYSEEEFRNMSVRDIHPSEALERVISEFEAQARGEKSLAPAIPCLRKDGTIVYTDIVTSKMFIDNYECNVGFFTDITARKQAEESVQRGYERLQETFHSTVTALASTVEMRDRYTAGHQPRVTRLACAIAEEMGLPKEQIEGIRMAASIHDIGKIMVPAEILNKPGPLTEMQYAMVKMHPRAGYDTLKGVNFPWPVDQIVLQHHELMDGSGYPQGLSGEEIMLEARILTVANVVEAGTAHRLYRAACSLEKALEEISQNKGKLYDPEVVDACIKLFTKKGLTFL
jgi:PAS domain S-box-containing protein